MFSELSLTYALSFLGTLYQWGGQSPRGVDCSGLVILVMQAEGIIPRGLDMTAQGIHTILINKGMVEKKSPSRGCLVFYGKDVRNITHVGICLNERQMIEAGGGDRHTKTPEIAVKKQAHVRVSTIKSRTDLVSIIGLP